MDTDRLTRSSPGGLAIPSGPDESGSRTPRHVAAAAPPEDGIRPLVDAARRSQAAWAATPLAARLRLLRRLRDRIAEHAAGLAEAAGRASVRNAAEALVAEVLPLAD